MKQNTQLQSTSQCWIQTYTGKKMYPLNPNVDDIDIMDIAHALSMQCRFTGHVRHHYSVGQHSILVSLLCDKEYALYGLLHDASEAYLSDIASPIKKEMNLEGYRAVEHNLQGCIYKKFGLTDVEPANIKYIDQRMLATEANSLLSPLHKDFTFQAPPFDFDIIEAQIPEIKKLFLDRFYELTRNLGIYDSEELQTKLCTQSR